MNFILTLVDFHFYLDTNSIESHVLFSRYGTPWTPFHTRTSSAAALSSAAEIYSTAWMCCDSLSPLLMGDYFQFFAITSNAVLNGLLLASLHMCWEFLSRINLKPSGLCIFTFNRHCQITQREGSAIFPSYRQLMKVPVQPSQALGNLQLFDKLVSAK